jgi:hypothetical protein
MARIRTIKPDFFFDEDLARLTPADRLAYIGLWCYADREGRLEDRPAHLRAVLFPYEPKVDIEAILARLARHWITRYEADGRKYIQINPFEKHQVPHIKERASTIPAPCLHSAGTIPAPQEGKGRELGRELGREGNGNAEQAVAVALVPSSPFPVTPAQTAVVWTLWAGVATAHGQPVIQASVKELEKCRELAERYAVDDLERALRCWFASPHVVAKNLHMFHANVAEVLGHLARNPSAHFREPVQRLPARVGHNKRVHDDLMSDLARERDARLRGDVS